MRANRRLQPLEAIARLPWLVLRAGRAGGGRAVGVVAVWAAWERLSLRSHRVQSVRPGSLFLFRARGWRGGEVLLPGGARVRRGDRVIELHLDNRRLTALRQAPGYSPWTAVATMREDLRALGGRLAGGELGEVAALHGVSFLGAAGGVLGFEVRPLPHSLGNALARYFMAGVDAVYHPDGLSRLDGRARERWPVEVWMSAAALPWP